MIKEIVPDRIEWAVFVVLALLVWGYYPRPNYEAYAKTAEKLYLKGGNVGLVEFNNFYNRACGKAQIPHELLDLLAPRGIGEMEVEKICATAGSRPVAKPSEARRRVAALSK